MAASAGLFTTAGEPASGMFIMSYIQVHASRWQQLACLWTAASGGTCARYHGNRCDLSQVAAPGWLPLAACGNAPGVCCISADPRATGRPWGTAVALPSHGRSVARLFKLSYRCSDWAWECPRLVQLAARQLTAVAQPLQGPVAPARSCVPIYAIDHHRNRPPPPILHRATKRRCFCERLAAATTDPRRAARVGVALLADSDPKARSALRILEEGR
jgi:hypothetical protein